MEPQPTLCQRSASRVFEVRQWRSGGASDVSSLRCGKAANETDAALQTAEAKGTGPVLGGLANNATAGLGLTK